MKRECLRCEGLGFTLSLKPSKLYACGFARYAKKCWRCHGSGKVKIKG